MQTQSAHCRWCLQICAVFHSFPCFRKWDFLSLTPSVLPPVPLGSICIISPKSKARYSGITLHDGRILAKAALRTGYLANVLSRPGPATREEHRDGVGGGEREGEQKEEGNRIRDTRDNRDTVTKMGLTWQEGRKMLAL